MKGFILLLVMIGSKILIAQVPNNNIQNRLTLDLNSRPIFSSTAQSTVEWKCINKALTNKCLVYHNDQWFNFSVPMAGTYFLNFSEQKCRDLQGLQLIVIEGNPCETKTYRILRCIPKISQDDVFLQLDSLKPETQYLANVDGFLGDFCEFGIQLSEKPDGLPRISQIPDTIKAQASRKGRLVNLEWTVDKDRIDQFQSFKVYRANPNAIKSDFMREQPVARNSYGAYILNYTATDSLQKEGTYIYRIVGIQKQTQFPFLLVARLVEYVEPTSKPVAQRKVSLKLNFTNRVPFSVVVYDDIAHSVLRKQVEEFDERKDRPFEINLGEFIDKGIKQFMILVSNDYTGETLEFSYRSDVQGRLIQN